MTLELPRLRAPENIVDNEGRPTLQFIQWWQRIAKALEDAALDNETLDATQTEALDILNDALERANAAYELLGPGAYSITASQTLPDDCRTALVDTSGGAVTVTLQPMSGRLADIVVKKVSADANNVVIEGDGAETIDGAANVTFNTQYESRTLRPASGAWHLI